MLEFREEEKVGFGALLVGAEGVPGVDELQAQHVGLKVVRNDPLRVLPAPLRLPGRSAR
ncbi:hypothetical protein ACFYZ2_16540 [Streptomyces sviceus]|uniref:hypothetical protein n=1 Tax=Streptomyces sviceus TaxID=285530 RepID=UPI0036C72E89